MNLTPHIIRVSHERMCFLTGTSLNLDSWEEATALAEGVAVTDGKRVGRVAFIAESRCCG